MSDQPSSGNNNGNSNNRPAGPNPNNNRRPNNQRRRPSGPNPNQNPNNNPNNNQRPPNPNANAGARPNPNPNQRPPGEGAQGAPRRRHGRGNNRPRNPNAAPQNSGSGPAGPHGLNIERIYDKYLNLLDQHLIARRKYHDLFYRADPAQKNKLERNFYNTLHDIRDFESKLAPEARELFEKRNNGLRPDNIYTSNHELPLVGENPPPQTEWADPHYLQTQQSADYAEDKEESVGSADDYLRYKNLL